MANRPDPFGLERERRIEKVGVRQVFSPFQPIQSLSLFFGRQSEVQKLIEHINTPGQHALLYGERGVGKSSLANVASEILLKELVGGRLTKKRCDSSDTFETIVAGPLAAAGIDIHATGNEVSQERSGKAGIQIPGIAEAGVDSKKTTTTARRSDVSGRPTTSARGAAGVPA